MIQNITEQANSFLSTLKTIYDRQGQAGKILFAAVALLAFCCLCSIPISLISSRSSPMVVASPILIPGEGVQPTPTPLFNFDFPTFTPFPSLTFAASTALPTLTPASTETQAPTQSLPAATLTSIPAATATPVPASTATQPVPTQPAATPTSGGSVLIIAVDKPAEYVDIQNLRDEPVDLRGWRLVSETGSQSCPLRGTLQPDEVLRIWARKGDPGFDCGFSINIWNDNEADPAVLYDEQGAEVSRYP